MKSHPFVTILTPVYNGEPFLAECIESVLAQDYSNWEYVIVNNCSTDGTLAVAQAYAKRDPRIRIVNNSEFVGCAENYNNAFRETSRASQYCKVVSADDRLHPQTLSKLVNFAMQHPLVGIIGSYQQTKEGVKWQGLPTNVTVLSGTSACRLGLLEAIHVFGNPTSVLYRSDVIHKAIDRTNAFFPHSEPHCDTSACYQSLQDCDFGFIHEVLSFERIHEAQVSASVRRLGADYFAYLDLLTHYGHQYLTESEYQSRRNILIHGYYQMLGAAMLKMRGHQFWEFHKRRLSQFAHVLDLRRVLLEATRELASELINPIAAIRKLRRALKERQLIK